MNIYKLTNEELTALHNEFNSTAYGKKAKFFSLVPIAGIVISLILFLVGDVDYDSKHFLIDFMFINLSLLGVTQLQYGNMLKDFAKTKENKETKKDKKEQ